MAFLSFWTFGGGKKKHKNDKSDVLANTHTHTNTHTGSRLLAVCWRQTYEGVLLDEHRGLFSQRVVPVDRALRLHQILVICGRSHTTIMFIGSPFYNHAMLGSAAARET